MIKKKRINLLGKNKSSKLSQVLLDKVVFYTTIIGIILFIAFLGLSAMNLMQKNKIQAALREKESLENFLNVNKTTDTDTAYFLAKKEQLKSFLQNDSQFIPYYTILSDSLSTASDSASVENLLIDNSRKTQFEIIFDDYDSVFKYVKYIESGDFLSNFENLTLIEFKLVQAGVNKTKSYQLNFEGKFKKLDN